METAMNFYQLQLIAIWWSN